MQAELQIYLRTHPDGEIQVVQVDDNGMEIEDPNEDTNTNVDLRVSEVSGIVDT